MCSYFETSNLLSFPHGSFSGLRMFCIMTGDHLHSEVQSISSRRPQAMTVRSMFLICSIHPTRYDADCLCQKQMVQQFTQASELIQPDSWQTVAGGVPWSEDGLTL